MLLIFRSNVINFLILPIVDSSESQKYKIKRHNILDIWHGYFWIANEVISDMQLLPLL